MDWWEGAVAAVGGIAQAGSGGGGGGAGVTRAVSGCPLRNGGAGGGGGGGGGPGPVGQPGGNAGGSFAVYVHNSSVVVDGGSLAAGAGGAGGKGGLGGAGGAGGDGGAGAFGDAATGSCDRGGKGGNGGRGSDGGRGGGGGGGAGGPSIAMFAAGTGRFRLKPTASTAAGSGGSGGQEGNSTTVNGAPGAALASFAQPTANQTVADFDGDGVKDDADACPAVAAATADGCAARPAALADSDGDQIPDGRDRCPVTARGVLDADEDGCPDITGGGGQVLVVSDPGRIQVLFAFNYSKSTEAFTRFTLLQIKGIPVGARLVVICRAPKRKRCPAKRFVKASAFGNVTLKKWIKKKLPAGTRLTATVTKPGFIGTVKTLTVRKRKPPAIGTRCLPPAATKSVSC